METHLNYKIVEVEWFDAQSGFSSPLTLEELEREEPLHSFSVGYLLKEDKEKIILGFMMFGNEGMFKHWQLIPKGMIIKIKQLQKEIGDDSQQPRMKQTRGGELKSDEGLHSTDNGSPADIVSKGFLDGYAEFWDNPEDNRWDKEEEKQDEK